MNNQIRLTILFALLTLGVSFARSQSAYNDTVHLTPAMIDSIRNANKIQPFERDIESNVFIPKGQWIAGVSLSYSQSNSNKYQFLIIENLNSDTYRFKVSPMVAYAFADDMAVGLKFSYERSLAKLERDVQSRR